ncbi:carbon-nitrogen hydrolase family protein [Mesorhizobium sp. BHbdii]
MPDPFQVSLAQIEIVALDPDSNRGRILEIAEAEAASGSRLILFPELAITGYVEPLVPGTPVGLGLAGFRDYAARLHEASETLEGPTISDLATIARQHDSHIVIGMALRDALISGRLTNASVLIGPDGASCVYHKVHLWQNEKLLFAAGQDFPVATTPIGRIGMQVCYDIRFPEATRALALLGAEVVTNVWASFRPENEDPLDAAQFHHRVFTRAQENGVYFLSCNRVGVQSGHCFLGNSVVAAPDGRIVASADSESEEVLRAKIDLEEVIRYRSFFNLWNDRRPYLYGSLTLQR